MSGGGNERGGVGEWSTPSSSGSVSCVFSGDEEGPPGRLLSQGKAGAEVRPC